MKTTVGDLLVSRLAQLGIKHLFGVPGDFNLQFLDQIEKSGAMEFVGCCNELNAAYAADGYARVHGIAAVATTYGVGDLSAACGIGGAHADHVPVVLVSGAPPLYAMRDGVPMHHSFGDGDYDNFMECFRQICVDCAQLTPDNADLEITRILSACDRYKRPVYVQLPSDVSHISIEVDSVEMKLDRVSNPERLESAIAKAMTGWKKARKPAILAGIDVKRLELEAPLQEFAELTGTPYALMLTARNMLPELHTLFLGIYRGAFSDAKCRERIEKADFLVTTSPRFIEINSGMYTQNLPRTGVVRLENDVVYVDGEAFYAVRPDEFLRGFIAALRASRKLGKARRYVHGKRPVAPRVRAKSALSQERLWPRMAAFVEPGDVVLAEIGTSSLGIEAQVLPPDITYISSKFWGAIGFALPATLGAAIAAPERRTLLFIGDGSLQVTAQELSTIFQLAEKTIIFVVNNRGYTIERCIFGMHAAYNDVHNWDYTMLPAAFNGTDRCATFKAATEGELEKVLKAAASGSAPVTFVELALEPHDAPEMLKKFGPVAAELDYGALGPQRTSA